jgi:tetratricopeptide (TPR) repeat protein
MLATVQGVAGTAGAAVQGTVRDLAEKAGAAVPWSLKSFLTRRVGGVVRRFAGGAATGPLPHFDYTYAREVGLSLIKDVEKWGRGAEFLRIAADGLPGHGPSLFVEIAKAYQRIEDETGALEYFGLARQAGRAYGVKNLGGADANAYFATLKYLGELAMFKGDLEGAAENFRLLIESPSANAHTYRALAEVYEKMGDFVNALRYNETALVYSPKDAQLLERKEHYYFNITPEQLQANLEVLRPCFDFNYCMTRSKTILDNPAYSSSEWLEVAVNLMRLATVVEANSFRARLLQARVKMRLGERDEAQSILEKIRDPKPESFASRDEEHAWYHAQQVLGDLYMEIGRPDLAIPCYVSFRESHLSGAKTVYKMGQAFEQTGDVARAIKCYKLVTGYEGNPLVWDAREALSRLQTS